MYIIFNSFVITREQTDYPSCGRCKACSSLYVEQLSVIMLEVSRRNTRPWFDRWDCKFLCRSLSRNVITWSVLRLNLYHPITFCRQKKTHQYSSLMSLHAVAKSEGPVRFKSVNPSVHIRRYFQFLKHPRLFSRHDSFYPCEISWIGSFTEVWLNPVSLQTWFDCLAVCCFPASTFSPCKTFYGENSTWLCSRGA